MNNVIHMADGRGGAVFVDPGQVFATVYSNDNQRTDSHGHYGQAGLNKQKVQLGASLRWFKESRAA